MGSLNFQMFELPLFPHALTPHPSKIDNKVGVMTRYIRTTYRILIEVQLKVIASYHHFDTSKSAQFFQFILSV